MKVRDLIARLVELRDADLLDDFGRELATSLERHAARGVGPTERQRYAAVALLKERDPDVAAAAVASVRAHVLALTLRRSSGFTGTGAVARSTTAEAEAFRTFRTSAPSGRSFVS